MKKFLKVSIITPSYNQGNYIEENIKSIINQNYPKFQHIIMDGGSTDNTIDILKKYSHLIWESEKDGGQAHALNKALTIASGDIIGWVNSDDMLAPGALSNVFEYFMKHVDHSVLVGNMLVIDENSSFLYKIPAKKITFEGLLNGTQCVTQVSTFFRRNVFEVVGNFDESLHYCMDHEFFLRVSRHFKFYTIDADLGMFRRYAESKTGSEPMRFIRERIVIRKMHGGRIFSRASLLIAYMYISEPLKRFVLLRKLIRKLKGANPDFTHYS